jgi:peptidoglycan hydrolase CwlO-like protein
MEVIYLSVIEERIGTLEKDVSSLKTDVHNLKGWQKKQNDTIDRVEGKIDKLVYWIMGVMATAIFTLLAVVLKN